MLREFTKQDWDAWAGCESKNPRIDYELKVYDEDEDKLVSAILLHDGSHVAVYYTNEEDELVRGPYGELDTEEEARKTADELSWINKRDGYVTVEELLDYL